MEPLLEPTSAYNLVTFRLGSILSFGHNLTTLQPRPDPPPKHKENAPMQPAGVITLPIDPYRRLEAAYRRAVLDEMDAIKATDSAEASALSGDVNEIAIRHDKWLRAAEAAERAAKAREELEAFRRERGL